MCGRYALSGPISRHRKNKPVDDLPDWYPSIGETADAAHEIKDARELKLIYHRVPKTVGSPKNDTPNLIEAIG